MEGRERDRNGAAGRWSVSLEEGPFDPSTSSALRLSAGPAVEKLLRFGDKRRLALAWRCWPSSFQFIIQHPKYTLTHRLVFGAVWFLLSGLSGDG